MKKLNIGDLVYSKEHMKQGIVQSANFRTIEVHLEGCKMPKNIKRINLFVKGDRVSTRSADGRWWYDNRYCFYAPITHNPETTNHFTVTGSSYNTNKVSYVRNIRHHSVSIQKQDTLDFCDHGRRTYENGCGCENYEPVDNGKEEMLRDIKILEIEAQQKVLSTLIKELKK